MKKKLLKTLCLVALGIFACSTITMAEEITTSAVIPETSTTVISTTDTTVASTTNTPTDATIVKKKPKIKSTIKKISLNKTVLRLNKKDSRSLKALYTDKKKEGIIWVSKNPSIAKVNKKGVVTGKKKGTTYVYCMSKSKKVKAKCKVVVGNFKYMAVTFDDGPSPYTKKLVDSLKKYNYNSTFFVVGQYVTAKKSVLKESFNNGNEIGSHSYDHAKLTSLSESDIKSEFSKTKSVVKSAIGIYPTLIRPPYGSFNDTVSKLADVPMIYWSVDTLDWKNRNVDYVYKEIIKSANKGEIILLHDSHPTSVDGFIKALPELNKKGYELVTVSELFKLNKKSLKPGTMYYNCY